MERRKGISLSLESATRIVEQALIVRGLKGQSEDPRLKEALSRLDGRRGGQIRALEELFGVTVEDLREELEEKRRERRKRR